MPKPTDSCVVEYNEDGSRTVTTVETIMPVTKKQQAAVIGGLTLLSIAPAIPLLVIFGLEKYEEKKAARKERKLTVVEND